jgi:predicted phosphoribosyltransferase
MFLNREEAGIRLALRLSQEKKPQRPLVVAIPRGGVVIGKVISEVLEYPLALLIVKKIGALDNPELALGAVGPGGKAYWDEAIVSSLKVSEDVRETLLEKTYKQVKEREKFLGTSFPEVKDQDIILVDDGVATGATAISATNILRENGANSITLATPVISKGTKKEISPFFEKIVSVVTPLFFNSVGAFYKEFPQVSDEEVRTLLKRD